MRRAMLAALLCATTVSGAHAQQRWWEGVERALGRTGAEQPDGVVRFSFPRSDLRVTVDGEEPRLYFMHFWANDDAVKLARGLRAALSQMWVR